MPKPAVRNATTPSGSPSTAPVTSTSYHVPLDTFPIEPKNVAASGAVFHVTVSWSHAVCDATWKLPPSVDELVLNSRNVAPTTVVVSIPARSNRNKMSRAGESSCNAVNAP